MFSEIGELQKALYFQIFDKRKEYITTKDIPA
jgi:hypothetical protein